MAVTAKNSFSLRRGLGILAFATAMMSLRQAMTLTGPMIATTEDSTTDKDLMMYMNNYRHSKLPKKASRGDGDGGGGSGGGRTRTKSDKRQRARDGIARNSSMARLDQQLHRGKVHGSGDRKGEGGEGAAEESKAKVTAASRESRRERNVVDGSIRSISLLGERNSGTNWIYAHLGLCFNRTLPVKRSLTRYKHWFQYDAPKLVRNGTLVVAMFRDPIEWTWAMKTVPHHASRHLDLPWRKFVTKEWTMERLWKDEAWKAHKEAVRRNDTTNGGDMKKNNDDDDDDDDGRICQERFRYHEVVSCLTRPYPQGYWGKHRKHRASQHQPFYEMKLDDPTGTPYANILGMRADKIRNFLDTASFGNVGGTWPYRYEELLRRGTEEFISKVERATGVVRDKERCKVYGPQNRRKREMEDGFAEYMAKHVDWETEALIGYEKPTISGVTDVSATVDNGSS